jgi:hypothetical protein
MKYHILLSIHLRSSDPLQLVKKIAKQILAFSLI